MACKVLLKQAEGAEFSEEEKAMLVKQLPGLDAQFGILTDTASQLRKDAREANMKALERNVEMLAQSLLSARRKIAGLVPAAPAPTHKGPEAVH